jgi:hypothetical protein
MSDLIDDQGNVYRQSSFSGEWHRQEGLFGAQRDTGIFGNPNIQRNLFGQPEAARTSWGNPIYSDDGRPLYQRSGSDSYGGGGGSGAGDALAGFLAFGIVILTVLAIAAIFSVLFKLVGAVINAYRSLMMRYPRAMLIFHLLFGMTFVAGIVRLGGFSLTFQLAGAALVPFLWAWLRLTRWLPLVFMPINCIVAGAALWFGADAIRPSWEVSWRHLSAGLPLIANLPLALASLPMLVWLWSLGARRFPGIFLALRHLVLGMLLWFALMRLWIDWQPYWTSFMAPMPWLLALTGWLILLLPLVLWLWRSGQERWPLPFIGLNLLVFGGLLGLTAFHTQPAWMDFWHHWMAGLPFAYTPILAISLAPFSFWGWGVAVNRWRRWLAVPNALLTGGILWLILDRTRSWWGIPWQTLWGPVPLVFDPALALLFAPLLIWVWKKGAALLPDHWGFARALLWGSILWWLVERSRPYWHLTWQQYAGSPALDPAWIALFFIPVAWVWMRLSPRWPRLFTVLGWVVLTLWLYWLVARFFPDSGLAFRSTIAWLPLGIAGWFALLRRHPWVALGLVAAPIVLWLLLDRFAPAALQDLIRLSGAWLPSQIVPFWLYP